MAGERTRDIPHRRTIMTQRHGTGPLFRRRVRLGLTRTRMAEIGGFPTSRIVRAEMYDCCKANGDAILHRWTPTLDCVPQLLDRLERKQEQEQEQETKEAVDAVMTVASDQWHLKDLRAALPEGSKITITLPSGLELKVV